MSALELLMAPQFAAVTVLPSITTGPSGAPHELPGHGHRHVRRSPPSPELRRSTQRCVTQHEDVGYCENRRPGAITYELSALLRAAEVRRQGKARVDALTQIKDFKRDIYALQWENKRGDMEVRSEMGVVAPKSLDVCCPCAPAAAAGTLGPRSSEVSGVRLLLVIVK